MSSSLQQGSPSNFKWNYTSPASHENLDVTKRQKSRKRKNLLNRYGSSKRRKVGTPSNRKEFPPNDRVVPSDTRATERYALSNAALNSGLNCEFQASQCTPERDGCHKSANEKQMKHEDSELCTDSGLDNRIRACSQAPQVDTAEILCSSPVMPSTISLEPLSKSACDKMQSALERRVLRPRRVCNKEIKENLPPLADSPLIVGRRVEVYWPLDAAWYRGLISAYDNVRKKHKVSYDDGEEEWLYLAREKFKFEMSLKSESALTCGKAKDSEVVKDGKDGLSVSALPSSSPKRDLLKNGTSNGLPMPVSLSNRKPTTSCVTITPPKVDAFASKVLSPEASLESKAIDLKIEKATKVFLRRHKGSSVGLRRGKTVVNGSVKGEGSFVYERRQRHEEKNLSRTAYLKKTEAIKRVKRLKGQHLQELQKSKEKLKNSLESSQHKVQAGKPCSEGPQNIEKLDNCTFQHPGVSANEQESQPKLTIAKQRKRHSSKDEASIARISRAEDMQESLNAGPSASEEVHKRTRRKQKVKNLAHTTLAAEVVKDVSGSVVQEHSQLACVELAALKVSKPSCLPQQNHESLPGVQGKDSVCCDKLPPESSRFVCTFDKLEPGFNQRLERRKTKGGRRYGGGRSGLIKRNMKRHKVSCGSKPSNKHENNHVAINKDNRLGVSSCEQIFCQEDPTSSPLFLMDAASMACKSMVSPLIGNVYVTRAALEGTHSQPDRRHCSEFDVTMKWNGRQSPLKAFYSTIHFPRPVVVSGLFTWQLYNMLEAVGLSGHSGFEKRFWWKGSTRDLANIVLLFISSVKSIPFSNQKCFKCWQGRVCHELWRVLSRKEQWPRDLRAILSPQADNLLLQHVRQLISGHCIVNMTSRQMLNIFSSYILKPYILALLCEKGAQLRVVVQQYLLSSCLLQDGISFKRQFVRSVKLRSHAGAEVDFVSCLALFPVMKHECMGAHKSMEDWTASVACAGFARLPIPLPSFKLLGNKGLQFTTASVLSEKTTHSGRHSLYLEQISGSFGAESWRLGSLRFPREAGDFLSHGRFSYLCDFRRLLDFYMGLCFDSMLQRWLDSPGSKSAASKHFSKKLHIKAELDVIKKDVRDSRDWEPESGCIARSITNNSPLLSGMESAYFDGKELLEQNTPFAVKEEYISAGSTHVEKEATSNASMGSPLKYLTNDLAYSASGSSSCSSEECLTKWKTTKMADVAFRPHDRIEQKVVYGESRYPPQFKKRAGSKRRPRVCEEETSDMQHLNLFCTANILLSNETRGWREGGVSVELQSRKCEWVISVQLRGVSYSHKVVESTITSRINRYTHAYMWKGGDRWILEFCDRTQWIRFKRMHEECGHRNARAAFVKQIPIPFVKQIGESFEGRHSDSFEKWPGEVENALNCTKRIYDMDSEDESWLARRSQRVDEKLSIDAFERIIDKLERITYLRQGEMVASDEVTELCESIVSEDAVLSVHAYWSEKRTRKDNALIRYFESPLPKKYQKQLDNWKQRMEELESRSPNLSKEELQRRYPEPPLFAFCWPSRGLDADNVSKRLQRQRPQKHINALKYTRTSSFDTSGFLQKICGPRDCIIWIGTRLLIEVTIGRGHSQGMGFLSTSSKDLEGFWIIQPYMKHKPMQQQQDS